MNDIDSVIASIRAHRNAKAAEIAGLQRVVDGLDIAIAALQEIYAAPVSSAPSAEATRAAAASPDATAQDAPPTADPQVSQIGFAEALAVEILADLPKLMGLYPPAPTVRDIAAYYDTNDPRARDACKRLRDTGRALFAIDQDRNVLCLRPRAGGKVAA